LISFLGTFQADEIRDADGPILLGEGFMEREISLLARPAIRTQYETAWLPYRGMGHRRPESLARTREDLASP
jgi:hypothetical protein